MSRDLRRGENGDPSESPFEVDDDGWGTVTPFDWLRSLKCKAYSSPLKEKADLLMSPFPSSSDSLHSCGPSNTLVKLMV